MLYIIMYILYVGFYVASMMLLWCAMYSRSVRALFIYKLFVWTAPIPRARNLFIFPSLGHICHIPHIGPAHEHIPHLFYALLI